MVEPQELSRMEVLSGLVRRGSDIARRTALAVTMYEALEIFAIAFVVAGTALFVGIQLPAVVGELRRRKQSAARKSKQNDGDYQVR